LSPKAEGYDRIVGFTRQHGISTDEFNNTLELLRISKSDPNRAFDLVSGILQNLAQKTGKALSPELQERIRLGHINEQDARRLSQSEAEAKLARERAEAATTGAAEQQRAEAWNTQVESVTTAVNEWSNAKRTSDPDWSLKEPHYVRALRAEVGGLTVETYPKTKQEAIAFVEGIVKQVDKDLKPFKKPKPAVDPPVSGEGSSSRNQAEPKNAVEAARLALAKMTG
jgi:hypothetical protein